MTNTPLDMLRRPIKVGQQVAWPYARGSSAYIMVREVLGVSSDGRVYLSGSPSPLQRPDRILILEGPYNT